MNRRRHGLFLGAMGLLLGLIDCSSLNTQDGQCDAQRPCPPGQACGANTAACQSRDLANLSVPAGMALVEGASFLMGNTTATDSSAGPDEAPLHLETVKSFFLDQTEVTVGAFRAYLKSCGASCAGRRPGINTYCNWTTAAGIKENHPINCVDWSQALAYCSWAKKRLPTEAEWEYAARGGTSQSVGSKYPWGNEEPVTPDQRLCWNRNIIPADGGSTSLGTCEVDKFPRTRFGSLNLQGQPGFADLAGNVEEWTATKYCFMSNGTGNCTEGYVVRGGWWASKSPSSVRAANRRFYQATLQDDLNGFRCAQDS